MPVQNGEEVEQNNARQMLTEVYDQQQRVLFLDGEPRPEPKFVKMATNNDNNLQVVQLQISSSPTSSLSIKPYGTDSSSILSLTIIKSIRSGSPSR